MKSLITSLLILLPALAVAGPPPPPRAPSGRTATRAKTRKPTKRVRTDKLYVTGKGRYSKPRGVRRDHRRPRGKVVFDVPVEVQRMHRDVKRLRIVCMVHGYGSHRVIANGISASQAIVKGRYKGNVKVAVNPRRGQGRLAWESYRCEVQAQASGKWFHPTKQHATYPADPDEPLKFANQGRL
jgi:hypothetical protein